MSTNSRIYLDFNATAPLSPTVRAVITQVLADPGNPSSIHAEGRRARAHVERARDQVARLVGRPREQVVFTSGGTEGNALGVLGLASVAERRGLPRVVASAAIDHPSLIGAVAALVARGWQRRLLEVNEAGALLPASLDGVGLVAVAAVNHELGTLAGTEILTAARAAGALIHVDAVQAAGKLALPAIDADALVISAHKLGGPKGAGALAIAADDGLPLVEAGHQERGRRPGTENVLGIAGLGAAAAAAVEAGPWAEVAALGDRLEAGLVALGDVRIHGGARDGGRVGGRDGGRVGGTINAGFTGARGESIVIALDLAGVAVSTGAACTSGSVQPSPVLLALGLSPDHARSAVRFSLGRTTTAAEIDAVLAQLPAIVARARRHH